MEQKGNLSCEFFFFPVCWCVHIHVFVFVKWWILLSYDTIFPAVITIDLAVDGDVSSVKLSVPGHGPLVP